MALKKVAVYVAAPYTKDELFNPVSPLNRDNCLAGMRELKKLVEAGGGECHTFDLYRDTAPETVLFLDIPERPVSRILGPLEGKVFKCVLLQEPELIIPRNWDVSLHAQFDRILTWNDELVDGKRYFKFNYGNALPSAIPKDLSIKEKLCAVLAGNQKSAHPDELYSKRVEAIRWFEANHPEDFDLYGRGWDKYLFQGPKLWRALNRIVFLRKLLAPRFASYKGGVESKVDALRRYRFSICYENSSGMPGYISEKIFDCFAAGNIPVYWGAPNVKDHIPGECFLDKREFGSYEALYTRMKTMTGAEYAARLAAIEAFLAGEAGRKFSIECFAETLVKVLLS